MDGIWYVLELEPTRDISAIKRAYAQKTKACHPEENPEGFLELRKAYEAALDYAESGAACVTEPDELPDKKASDAEPFQAESGEARDEGWTLCGKSEHTVDSNPYTEHEAVRNFLELYTGKQRREQKRWLDYFTSDAFLDAAWDWRFTALLLEHVTQLEGTYPVNREFLNWLCVAYQFTVRRAVYLNPDGSERTEFDFQIQPGARFEGQESVFEIATKGPVPKKFQGNELAVFESFTEYHQLTEMAGQNVWSEREIGECSGVIGRYAVNYITDKCQQRWDMDYERHPAGVRLITHFFRRDGLPEELYRIAWQKLDLETAVMGRAKIIYGPLRELALQRLPQLAGQKRESFAKLRADFLNFAVSTCKRNGQNAQATNEDIRKTDAFFARGDFQQALLDRRFVEEEMLHTWVNENRCDYYLNKVIAFYTEHETAPCAGRVIERAKEMLKIQKMADRMKKDRESAISEDAVTLTSSPFFRHWLNTGFYEACDITSGGRLSDYLNRELPYLPEWSKAFLGAEEEITPKTVLCGIGEDTVEVRFHLRYMAFFCDGQPVYRPCLEWERMLEARDTDTFFFCLPITVTTYDRFETVRAEILRRLADTAAPEEGRGFIAACLAGQVCSLPLPGKAGMGEAPPLSPESVLPFELFAEDTDHLYGCEWFEQEPVLTLFEQLPIGRKILGNEVFDDVTDVAGAAALARRMLEETLRPPRFPMELLVNLPDAVYAKPDLNIPPLGGDMMELSGEAVTREKLEELLTQFADNQLERLEFSWKITAPIGEELDYDTLRSLVFIKGGGYACLYFDDFRARSYALLEKPELYGKMKGDTAFVPFRQGRLHGDVVHRSFSSIRRHLDVIFRQVSWQNNVDFRAGGIWSYAAIVFEGRAKYYLDKQLLGGFPMERAHNRPDAPFHFFIYPDFVLCVDEKGRAEALEVVQSNRGRIQQLLIRFLQGDFCRLRLTWGNNPERRRHIVLLHDSGRFLMAWIQEEKRTVQYHVSDASTYMDVEGKKYPKDMFQGRVTPAYLIHDGVTPLRNALELLLANLNDPDKITVQFAEYADEKPVKARPYEVLWAELAGDALSG